MSGLPSSAQDLPVRAAMEAVRAHGIEPDRCEILQQGHTVVVRLTDSLVARVAGHAGGTREGAEWFARETAIARHLTRHHAPVIPLHPDMPAEPLRHRGLILNFWEYVERTGKTPVLAAGAQALLECLSLLGSLPESLPPLAILTESLDLLDSSAGSGHFTPRHGSLLRTILTETMSFLDSCPHQPLHGDAHPGNLMATTRGLLWTDWEDAFTGPPEWDLASLIWNARHLEGPAGEAEAGAAIRAWKEAGGSLDTAVLDQCLLARAAVMTAWYPVLYPNPDPSRLVKLQFRLDWLEARHR